MLILITYLHTWKHLLPYRRTVDTRSSTVEISAYMIVFTLCYLSLFYDWTPNRVAIGFKIIINKWKYWWLFMVGSIIFSGIV